MTCGDFSGVDKTNQGEAVSILIMKDRKHSIASDVEKYRFMDEEVNGQGCELIDFNWYELKKYLCH